MLAFSVIVAILVSAAAVAYVAWPLVQPGPAPVIIEDDRLTDLIGRKDATLTAIKELEFDYRTGKLSDEDYQRMDQRLRRQAIGYIQQIEKLAPESTRLDGRIEAEILALRKTVNGAASADAGCSARATAGCAADSGSGIGTPIAAGCGPCAGGVHGLRAFLHQLWQACAAYAQVLR